jgi:phage FluMu gp28-like protein
VPFRQQEQIFFALAAGLPNLCGARLDARGNGQFLAEVALQRFGPLVVPVMITTEWYRETMPKVKAALEDAVMDLPRDDGVLTDLRALRMDKGIARIPDQRVQGKGGQRHGDAAIAIAMAYDASLSPAAPIEHTAAGNTRAGVGAFEAATPGRDAPFDFGGRESGGRFI